MKFKNLTLFAKILLITIIIICGYFAIKLLSGISKVSDTKVYIDKEQKILKDIPGWYYLNPWKYTAINKTSGQSIIPITIQDKNGNVYNTTLFIDTLSDIKYILENNKYPEINISENFWKSQLLLIYSKYSFEEINTTKRNTVMNEIKNIIESYNTDNALAITYIATITPYEKQK